uniref:Uncharacterized protein n=1 Tax=Arundo donax TaxID=35708 RepID=A0A0A9C298_ARUDO
MQLFNQILCVQIVIMYASLFNESALTSGYKLIQACCQPGC